MLTFSKELAVKVLQAAKDVNFYGKRLRDSRLECCEEIAAALTLKSDPAALLDWLDSNKPEKPAAKKSASGESNKPEAGTILTGTSCAELKPLETADRVIIVAAQNNTAVNSAAWQALQNFAAHNYCQIIALPIWYNKNAFSQAVESESEYFADAVKPYLIDYNASIFNGLVSLYGAAAIPATATMPVNAARKLNGGELVTVVGSARQQMDTLPHSAGAPIKEAWSTGSVTVPNYTRSRAGTTAEADHIFGGVLLELTESGRVLSSNLQYKNGSIEHYTDAPSGSVLVLGDLHSEMRDPANWVRTLDLIDLIKPDLIVLHDILHFSVASHHGRNKGDHLYRMKDRLVIDDLAAVINDLNELACFCDIYVTESNHHSALDNWLHDVSYNAKRDPRQAKLYYLLNWLMADAIDNGEEITALELAFKNLDQFSELPELADNIIWGDKDQSFVKHGFALQLHGHQGTNGARGSAQQFAALGFPMVCGHTHSPQIRNGRNPLFVVGVTASLKQGYNAGGGSTWNQSHVVVFPNGSAQIVPCRGLYV